MITITKISIEKLRVLKDALKFYQEHISEKKMPDETKVFYWIANELYNKFHVQITKKELENKRNTNLKLNDYQAMVLLKSTLCYRNSLYYQHFEKAFLTNFYMNIDKKINP